MLLDCWERVTVACSTTGMVILKCEGAASLPIRRVQPYDTDLNSHVSSSMTPIGRFPFAYSLQYPPCKITPSVHDKNENPLRGLLYGERWTSFGGSMNSRRFRVHFTKLHLSPLVFLGIKDP